MGGGRFQRSLDLFQHCFRLPEDLIIPEAQYTKTLGFQFAISILVVMDALLVLSPIEFNGKLRLQACEVGDESGNRHLPPESVARELSAPKIPPKVSLRVCGLVA